MHSPEVVAFNIRRPWPKRDKTFDRRRQWSWRPPYFTFAGREWRFPELITVWHNEPGGHDALSVCGRQSHWQWHVHHWSIQIHPLQVWRRRLLTRCEWCGGRSTKGDSVNHSHTWDGVHSPWWRGERGLYHADCSSVWAAHRMCLCDDPLLDHSNYGQCALCSKYRAWRHIPTIPDRYLAALPEGSRIPAEKRDWLKAEWAKLRAECELDGDR